MSRFSELSDMANSFLGVFEPIFYFGVLSYGKSALPFLGYRQFAVMLVNLRLYDLKEYFVLIKSCTRIFHNCKHFYVDCVLQKSSFNTENNCEKILFSHYYQNYKKRKNLKSF